MSGTMTTTSTDFILSFSLAKASLTRKRYLVLREGPIQIPPISSVYKPVRDFLLNYKTTGYPFRMKQLLHVAGVQLLGEVSTASRARTLFATGGLFLALDQNHTDLCFTKTFGDFTSGFSHQFGVALALMSMSTAFNIPWDLLNQIPVKGKKVLDYQGPTLQGWLKLEAKGISTESWSKTRQNAYSKKLTNPKDPTSPRSQFSLPTALVAVIVQASRLPTQKGVMEIIDPDFEEEPETYNDSNQIAGRYLHYMRVAKFAGLIAIANEFRRRANSLINKKDRPNKRKVIFNDKALTEINGREYAGVQWRVGDLNPSGEGIWFYHGVEKDRISHILQHEEFLLTRPFHLADSQNRLSDIDGPIESILPNGSYFGIGLSPLQGLLEIDVRHSDIAKLNIVELK